MGGKEYYNTDRDFVKKQLSKTDGIIALSSSWKEFYSDVVGVKNVCVIPNIVPEPKVFEKEKPNGCFKLLYLGHICKAKGVFDLVEMIEEHHDEYRGKMMLHVGGGMYEEEKLKKIVFDHQLQDVVTMHGWILNDDKAKLLSNADAFILPSYAEGQPVSIIEAMSYGLPILSTKVGGIPEMVVDGITGVLVAPKDVDALADGIISILNDTSTLSIMENNIRKEYFNGEKSWDSIADKYNKLYSEI